MIFNDNLRGLLTRGEGGGVHEVKNFPGSWLEYKVGQMPLKKNPLVAESRSAMASKKRSAQSPSFLAVCNNN